MSEERREHDGEMLRLLQSIDKKLSTMHTKLFGDEDSENEHGRIPVLEKASYKYNLRIKRLEELGIKIITGVGAVWAGIEFYLHNLRNK